MLTANDIRKLIEAEKEVFPTKTDFAELKGSFSTLQSSTDSIAKQIKDYHEEMVVLVRRVQRMEEWIRTAANKIGIPYNA